MVDRRVESAAGWDPLITLPRIIVVSPSPEPSWPDASAAADAMTTWYRRVTQAPDEQPWSDITVLLAMALWQIACDQDVPVFEAVLDARVFGQLRFPEKMLAPPHPAEAGVLPRVEGQFDPLLRRADAIMGLNHTHLSPGHELGNTEDGPDPCTVGDRIIEIHQDHDRERLPPLPETEVLARCASATATALNRRAWLPTTAERALALKVHTTMFADSPEASAAAFDRSWLARTRRLARAGDILRSTQPSQVSPLLTALIDALTGLIDAVTTQLPELEAAWSARPADQRLPRWERSHIPSSTRSRVHDAEFQIFLTRGTLAACFTGNVDY